MIKYLSDIFLEDKYYDDAILSNNIDFIIVIINEFTNLSGEKIMLCLL